MSYICSRSLLVVIVTKSGILSCLTGELFGSEYIVLVMLIILPSVFLSCVSLRHIISINSVITTANTTCANKHYLSRILWFLILFWFRKWLKLLQSGMDICHVCKCLDAHTDSLVRLNCLQEDEKQEQTGRPG